MEKIKAEKPFNRTIVELKLICPDVPSTGPLAFNRTIVELKHESSVVKLGHTTTFNRTIVELKLYMCTCTRVHVCLLIVP